MPESFGSRDKQVGREAAVLKDDRRRQPRGRLRVPGCYVLADRGEFPCTLLDASASAISLAAGEGGEIGDKVAVTFDKIGRIEGQIVRHLDEGFVMRVIGRSRAAEALADLVERQYRGMKGG